MGFERKLIPHYFGASVVNAGENEFHLIVHNAPRNGHATPPFELVRVYKSKTTASNARDRLVREILQARVDAAARERDEAEAKLNKEIAALHNWVFRHISPV